MKLLPSIAITLLLVPNLFAQESPYLEADESYRSMVLAASSGYPIDFNELRLVYARSSYFQPYYDVREEFKSLILQERWGEAKNKIGQLMWQGAFSLVDFSHTAVTVFDALGEKESSSFFKYIGEELLKTIYHSGSGLDEDNAWQVINIREEYFLLNSLNYRVLNHRNYQNNNKIFDELEVEEPLTGKKQKFYFDASRMQ